MGYLVTETFGYDGGREVTVAVPDRAAEAIVFAGDGQLIAGWGASLAAEDGPAVMVVGVHRTDDPDEMARIREYSPGFEPAVFEAHETFFVDEVGAWVRSRFGISLPPGRTAVCGVSASGELALALGLRHPETFGAIFCASPGGGYQPPAGPTGKLTGPLPRTYLVAGRQEPWFRDNAARWADALGAAGGDVVMTERDGDHGDPFWAAEFPLMVRWAFG